MDGSIGENRANNFAFFCIAKRLQRPVLSFFLWRQEKQLDKSQCFYFFKNLRGRWDLAKFGYRSGQRG